MRRASQRGPSSWDAHPWLPKPAFSATNPQGVLRSLVKSNSFWWDRFYPFHFMRSPEVNFFLRVVWDQMRQNFYRSLTGTVFNQHRWWFDFMSTNESLDSTPFRMGTGSFSSVFPIGTWISMKLGLGWYDASLLAPSSCSAARGSEGYSVLCLHCWPPCVFSSLTQL